ncbi:hypothetical protein [Virgisporangium aurantiacum]|nr:hypothetical protein [Virgisporangium aurantiacum]
MRRRLLWFGAVAVVGLMIAVVVGVVVSRRVGASPFKENVERTAHWTEAHGDGYRRGDQPEAIAKLLEYYAGKSGGQVLDTAVYQGPQPGGHVDVLFYRKGGKFERDARECWRFSFRKPVKDFYVREITYAKFDCPSPAG